MTATDKNSEAPNPVKQFQPIRNYRAPTLPAADVVQRVSNRLRDLWQRDDSEPTIASEQLQRLEREQLDELVSPPACGPLINELQSSLSDWVLRDKPDDWLKLVILPPCDENGIVETWARDGGHVLLDAPARSDLMNSSCPVPDFSGDGVLVIPHLEHWFLRHQNGLGDIRALLAQLQSLERHCVIGCNSWAWAFLCKAVSANTLLPSGFTFQAFDAERLHRWFTQLNSSGKITIRSSQSGNDLLGENSSADFFKLLAARSQGIPWVAWNLWRRSLRTGVPGEEAATAASNNEPQEQVLWAAALEDFSLPGEDSATTLLVLQALLIHGSLSPSELNLVLPLAGHSAAVAALVKAGFVERNGNQLRLVAAAYPAIRSGLKTAGFPLDVL